MSNVKILTGKNKDGEWGYTLLHRSIVHQGAVFYETMEEAQEQGNRAKQRLLKTLYGDGSKNKR